jgi:signal transduction histidine kinase
VLQRDASGRPRATLEINLDMSEREERIRQQAAREELERKEASERHARADAEEALRSRDEFLALVSHDLKAPLTAIKMRTQLVRRRAERDAAGLPPYVGEGLGTIESTVDRLSRQVNELVDMARLQAGLELTLDLEELDLVELVLRTVAESAHDRQVHAVSVDTGGQPLIGRWDATRLYRVLTNLLTNAVKYSPSGGEIQLRLRREGQWAVAEVQDQGIGIPALEASRVFERFYRASNVAEHIPGEGIGLAAALHIVEQHGGTLQVASQEGVGTTFTLRLPL